jgi:hypothetical protein
MIVVSKRGKAKLLIAILIIVSLILPTSYTSASDNNQSQVFNDISGHWAESQIIEGVNRGILYGVGDNKFAPNETLTYEQFMSMLGRIFSQTQFISDRTSGCNMLLINVNEAFQATNGDFMISRDYRTNYVKNHIGLDDKIVKNSDYLKAIDFSRNGVCTLRHWDSFTAGADYNRPYNISKDSISNIQPWSMESIFEVPYVAQFVNYYNLLKDSGLAMKDYNYYTERDGLHFLLSGAANSAARDYQDKRVTNVYDNLNLKYISNGRKDLALKREDMALILYSFLDYQQQKLINTNQPFAFMDIYDSKINKEYSYKSFSSNYSDLPKYFQTGTIINNSDILQQTNSLGYTYKSNSDRTDFSFPYMLEKMSIDKLYKSNVLIKENIKLNLPRPINITNRGIILSVSDAGLLTGAYGKFNPKGNLTRAEGISVALRLDKYIKERYDLIN